MSGTRLFSLLTCITLLKHAPDVRQWPNAGTGSFNLQFVMAKNNSQLVENTIFYHYRTLRGRHSCLLTQHILHIQISLRRIIN
uniref:Secreted protein n=1 Tax=Rhipicephalus zambeziensis TaxID=60191 RepID=A0A224Y7F1_9ACAR